MCHLSSELAGMEGGDVCTGKGWSRGGELREGLARTLFASSARFCTRGLVLASLPGLRTAFVACSFRGEPGNQASLVHVANI